MMACMVPGPQCSKSNPATIDKGTLHLNSAAPQGISGPSSAKDSNRALHDALDAMHALAQNFAWQYINDANARAAYVNKIATASIQIQEAVRNGHISAEEGAQAAQEIRNIILEEVRAITSAIGRANAEKIKGTGLTLDELFTKVVNKRFPSESFATLTAGQKKQVYMDIIESSGRSRPAITRQMTRWVQFGRVLTLVTVAIAVYNIWEAKNKVRQSVQEGGTLLGGALGAAAASASAGFICGPGAPVCV